MKFLFTMLLALVLTMPAHAKPCYSKAEFEAEKLLRLHSELMVITVTCRYGSQGQNLTAAYSGFTQNNLSAIKYAEKTLINFYKQNASGDPVSHLDVLRTRLGNEFGQQIADVSAPSFCAVRRDRVVSLMGAPKATVGSEADRLSASAKAYAPVCP